MVELYATDAREVSRCDVGNSLGLANAQFPVVERNDEPRGKEGLHLLDIGVGVAEISEDVPAALDTLQLLCHRSCSVSRFCCRGRIEIIQAWIKEEPHSEEPRKARHFEGWATDAVPEPTLRDAALRTAPQGGVGFACVIQT